MKPEHPPAPGAASDFGARLLGALQRFTWLVTIGDGRRLATHPASTTHRQHSPQRSVNSGVGEDQLRLRVGIEHIDDLLAHLDQALAAGQGACLMGPGRDLTPS